MGEITFFSDSGEAVASYSVDTRLPLGEMSVGSLTGLLAPSTLWPAVNGLGLIGPASILEFAAKWGALSQGRKMRLRGIGPRRMQKIDRVVETLTSRRER